MGALVLGTTSGLMFLLTALLMDLPLMMALAAHSAGGVAVALIVAGLQARAAGRRRLQPVTVDAISERDRAKAKTRAELHTQSA
ncbi:hypothetical protein [Albimonas pacifica]|uniref:Uncharacterized protein n=1 Tax=Albimonas pacifica TaxID=1114924 RepID=A0A1I3DWL9_9RHOB|nr:hypothetical protein [Albimonas pacifica]SFH91137.1 hypothetical protein SAMN05216258_10356 [Albimonas pacifica]